MIAIGIAAILSGDYAGVGNEMKLAAEMAIEECNAAGGIFGNEVSTYVLDDQADVEQGRRVARELCGNSEVLGVVRWLLGCYEFPTTSGQCCRRR